MTLKPRHRHPILRAAAVAIVVLGVAGDAAAQDIGVFVTSTQHTGNLGGMPGGDMICQGLANAAFPGTGPWMAWLSSSMTDARDRIPLPGMGGAFVRAAEPTTIIATDLVDLTDGGLTNGILLDENGADTTLTSPTWTGTVLDGTAAPETCGDWMDASNTAFGRFGVSPQAMFPQWTQDGNNTCDNMYRLYCFGSLAPAAPTMPLPAMVALAILLLGGGAAYFRRRQLAL